MTVVNKTKIIFLAGLFGVVFALPSVTADAQEISFDDASDNAVPCYSSGTAPLISFRRYVECASCTSVKGKPTGGSGQCTP